VLSVALVIASLALVVALAAAMLHSVLTRKRRWPELRPAWWYPDRGDDPGTGVREPRRPLPSDSSAATYANPDD
jgi:hypothetical protein